MFDLSNEHVGKLLSHLNPEQEKTVLHPSGPMVVFAGAGSGKTRVITTRIAVLLESGVKPHEILAVTFTNKASREMKERLEKLNSVGHLVHVGTFHSACSRWLREFAGELGFSSDYTIYDDRDSLQAIKTVLKELKVDVEETPPRDFLNAIGRAKTYGWLPADAQKHVVEHPHTFPPLGVQVYKRYQEYLASCNAMDFNDLLMNMLLLLRSNQRVRSFLQKRYKHILVDEYQDTNPTQFALVSLLVNDEKNLFVVGDDDQSIYSWRGADPSNIIDFKSHFPGAKEVRLEQNYRSSGNIVKAASAVIGHNTHRASKVLWTANEPGEAIEYRAEYDGESESWWVCDRIKEELSCYHYRDIAIFYRVNAQSRQIEDSLRKENIPYKIYGSLKFYDRAEIKDMMGYFRLLVNPDDDVSFRRVVNTPTRGIGKKAVEMVSEWAFENQVSMMTAAKQIILKNPSRATTKLSHFINMMDRIKANQKSKSLADLLSLMLDEIQYKAYVDKKFPEQSQDKMSNIHELGTALAEYEQESSGGANLAQWLKDISLGESNPEEEGKGGVSLMTLHSAKGLEYPRVYLLGVEEGLLPHNNSLNEERDIEEERRLFYVGMTRARKKITLISAQKRRVFNQWVSYYPSRFLKEIPKDLFSTTEGSVALWQEEEAFHQDDGLLKLGGLVSHPTYGKGEIKNMDQDFGVVKVVVDFQDHGLRRVRAEHLEKPGLSYDYNL